jgi:hypothetical protein
MSSPKATLSNVELVALAKAVSEKTLEHARDALGDDGGRYPISIRIDLTGMLEHAPLTERNVFSAERVRAAFLAEGIDPALVDRCFQAGTKSTVCRGSARFLGEVTLASRTDATAQDIEQSADFIRRMRGA